MEAFDSGRIARGPRAAQFEAACAERLGASHAIACSNGTSALELTLRALGVGPGDDVVVPTLSWLASASAIRMVGARPVFADVDERSHNVNLITVAAAWTSKTKALIAVDMAGIPCDLAALRVFVEAHDAWLIEDAAHAMGSRHDCGSPVGADGLAHASTFSFHPAKTITTGEGGLITCEDGELAGRLRRMRSGGLSRCFEGSRGPWDYRSRELGSNYHMTELQAALGLAQLQRMEELIQRRRRAGSALLEQLAEQSGLLLPDQPSGSCWNLCIVELPDTDAARRDRIVAHMQTAGIGVHVHYPLLHRQPVFDALDFEDRVPVATAYFERCLSLPLFPDLTSPQIERITQGLGEALEHLPSTAPLSL